MDGTDDERARSVPEQDTGGRWTAAQGDNVLRRGTFRFDVPSNISRRFPCLLTHSLTHSRTRSLTHSENVLLSPVCVMSARSASLHPSNSSPPRTVDTLTAASSTVLAASSLLAYRSTYLRASPVRTRCKIHGRANCFSVRWYDLPSTTTTSTSLLFLSASTTTAAVDVNRQQERGERAQRSPFPFILCFFRRRLQREVAHLFLDAVARIHPDTSSKVGLPS